MSADLNSKLCQALIEVVADLSFICLMELPGGEPPPNTGQQLQAMIPVHQPYKEKFLLTIESRLMQEITCNIYGLDAVQLTKEHQLDTLNELLNNIAGKFMQILTPPSIQFELGLPVLDIDRTISGEPALNLVFHSDESYLVFSLIGTNLIGEVRK
ncbi:MAG: chemotaxis protein CheX [Thermacetogeniaceae bacterium]